MRTFVVRPYEARDEARFYEIRSLTYNDGDPIDPQNRGSIGIDRYVAESEGVIAGIYVILPMTCTRGQSVLKSAGIAAVAVPPELRRSGVGLQMMIGSLAQMREEGYAMASLYPFRETFYRRAGYERCGVRMEITVPIHRLPKVQPELPIRRLIPSDWQEFDDVFTQFAKARSGVSLRDERLWHRVLAESRPLHIYVAGNPAEAYAVVSHKVDFFVRQTVSDFAWSTLRGYETLLSYFANLGINKTEISWFEPSDGPYLARYSDQGVRSEVVRSVMFRVLDVPACLEALQPEESGEFLVRVHDDGVPENSDTFQVQFGGGEVRVKRSQQPADFEIDIRQWTQGFLGQPSLDDLHRNGLIVVHRSEGIQAAKLLLPPLPVYLPDFF